MNLDMPEIVSYIPNTQIPLSYYFNMSKKFPHVAEIQLMKGGTLIEIMVMGFDYNNGDLYFIQLNTMDTIDRKRLLKIITRPGSHRDPLWQLLSNDTLPNGMNALTFFHQLVYVKPRIGEVFKVGTSQRGMDIPRYQTGHNPYTNQPPSQPPVQPSQPSQPPFQQHVQPQVQTQLNDEEQIRPSPQKPKK